jgi:AcrR family transcriptional regulator
MHQPVHYGRNQKKVNAMANKTFQNLPDEKRLRFISVAMHEFAHNDFDSASVGRIVRTLGIAKGSVYQYFDDKKALWIFLKQHAEEVRLEYTRTIYRKDYPDFYHWFRAVKEKQIKFHLERPDEALLLHRILTFESSMEVMDLVSAWRDHQLAIFEKLIEAEKLMGTLDPQLSSAAVARFLQAINHTLRDILIQEDISGRSGVGENQLSDKKPVFSRIGNALSVFTGKQKEREVQTDNRTKPASGELLDDLITLLEKAMK